MLLAAAATVEVEKKLEAEAKVDLEASVTEDENDMACKWRRLRKGIRPAITITRPNASQQLL